MRRSDSKSETPLQTIRKAIRSVEHVDGEGLLLYAWAPQSLSVSSPLTREKDSLAIATEAARNVGAVSNASIGFLHDINLRRQYGQVTDLHVQLRHLHVFSEVRPSIFLGQNPPKTLMT